MPLKKYIRRNIYQWHRLTSLVVALPIMMWTLSGFLHPVMNSFKPAISSQYLPAAVINPKKISISLKKALVLSGIAFIENFRIVAIDSNYYYQVRLQNSDTLSYFNCTNGALLHNGDQQYIASLAKRYLWEQPKQTGNNHHHMGADISDIFSQPKKPVQGKITSIELIKEFTEEYKKSNVLLPVYKVTVDRPDHIRLYIEAGSGRLATAIDDRKAAFSRFFSYAHTWSFMDGMGMAKNILIGSVAFLCFLTSIFGFYIYNLTNRKMVKANTTGQRSKTWHRWLGNLFVLTTLLYAISGAWHSFHKIGESKNEKSQSFHASFASGRMDIPFNAIAAQLKEKEKLSGISIARINGQDYWQVFTAKGKEKRTSYFNTAGLAELLNGDVRYAQSLALYFSGTPGNEIRSSLEIREFNNQYSMMNKRLPVVEVALANREKYYVETSTGTLAVIANGTDKAERFSFSNLHMHHYLEDWMGKTTRNIFLVITTLGLLLLALTGISIFVARQLKKRNKKTNP